MSASTPYTESWLPGPQSTQFYTRTYTPSSSPKAVIVFLHGFAEHIGRYIHFHPLLPERGIAVFTFDQRGFGKTAQDVEGHKSKKSAYGKTSTPEQMADIEWAVGHAQKEFPGLPTFLMGHSMGGGEVLVFATRGEKSAFWTTISSLAGVVATSPLIEQTKPAPKLLRWVGGKASIIAPHTLVPASVVADDLSHDPACNEAYLKDPLIKQAGTLRGLHDMLSSGEALLRTDHKSWPENLPLLLLHGTEDMVTSYKSTQAFHEKITARDKKLSLFTGAYHELPNEPDGVKEKLAHVIAIFVDARLSSTSHTIADERSKM